MISLSLLFATFLAGFIYTIAPGPAFLALFTLGAAKGRRPGAWFMTGHLVGDVTWSVAALAAIVGVSQIGPMLFDILGICCGVYLIYMGVRAITTRKDGKATVGLTPPKSNWAQPLTEPPYVAVEVTCGITFTFGGVRIDPASGQVLDLIRQPIPGLYAAGEMVGGLFYFNYPSGTGLVSGAVFGRLAGSSAGAAAKEDQ